MTFRAPPCITVVASKQDNLKTDLQVPPRPPLQKKHPVLHSHALLILCRNK